MHVSVGCMTALMLECGSLEHLRTAALHSCLSVILLDGLISVGDTSGHQLDLDFRRVLREYWKLT